MSDIIIKPDQETPPVEEPTRLTSEGAQRLAGALAQLEEVRGRKIVQPGDDKIIKGLETFITNNFLKYANDFLGAWFTVQTEYNPLVLSIARVLRRTDGIRQQWFEQQQAFIAAQQPSESQETK